MEKTSALSISLFAFFLFIITSTIIAQVPVSDPACVYCGAFRTKGESHKPGCPLATNDVTAPSAQAVTSIEQLIMQSIFSSMFNYLLSSGSQTDADKLRQQQDEQKRLADMIAQQKRYNDSIAQARYDIMMKEYKKIGESDDTSAVYKKINEGEDLKYKVLGDKKLQPTIKFNCKITSFNGDVKVVKSDGQMISLSKDKTVDLTPGDWLATGPNSRVKLHYNFESGGEDIILGQNSAINIITDEFCTHVPKFVRGNYYVTNNIITEKIAESYEELLSELNKQKNKYKRKFEIRGPSWAMAVRGTEFTVEIDSAGSTTVCVFDGIVELANNYQQVTVMLIAGTKGFVDSNGLFMEPISIKEEEITKWWKEE